MSDARMFCVQDIQTWDRAHCTAEWDRVTNSHLSAGLSTKFLRKALAFELQCKDLSGHSTAVRRQLKAMLGDTKRVSAAAKPTPTLTTGTQLVREWNGRIYRVLVTEDGFEMDGQSYRSLSAIAKRITGAGWSGPRFFGLKTS